MFENDRHIMILHGTFLSAQSKIAADKSMELLNFIGSSNDVIDSAVDLIQSTVDFIVSGYGGTVPGWSIKNKKQALESIHTALFYKVLKSCSISCSEAEEFYESISNAFIPFDWRFYLKLVSHSYFLQYFEQCLMQLPISIVDLLLEWTLKEIELNPEMIPSVLHPVLTVMMQKALDLQPSIDSVSCSKFDFDLKVMHEGSNGQIDPFFAEVLSLFPNDWEELNVCSPLLNCLLFLMDSALASKGNCYKIMQSQLVQEFFMCVKEYFSNEARLSCVISCNFDQYISLKACYISYPAYNIFLLYHRWQDLNQKLETDKSESDVRKILEEIVELLYSSHPFQTNNSSEIDHCLKMLICMINSKLEGVPYAMKVLLENPEWFQRQEVLCCFKNNMETLISNLSYMELLLDVAVYITSPKKEEIINLFITAFKELPTEDQHALLRYHILKHGTSVNLKSSSYESDITTFFLKVDTEKLIELITPLCIQSFEETLQKIIFHSIEHGASVKAVKALKSISFSFTSCSKKSSLPLLLKCLKCVAIEDLTGKKQEHFLSLIKEIVEAFVNTDAFPYDQFFTTIIQPKLHMQSSLDDMMYFLQLLNIVMNNSHGESSGAWLENINISALVVWLSSVVSFCITSMNMQLKELPVSLLNNLWKLQENNPSLRKYYSKAIDKKWLQHCVSTMHPAVQFYIWDFIGCPDIDLQSLDLKSLLWWYAVRGKICVDAPNQLSQHRFRHALLVKSVAQVIPFLTTEEFLHLLDFFMQITPPNEMQDLASQCISRNVVIPERKLSAFYSCEVFVDALILLHGMKTISLDWCHIVSSFANAVEVCSSAIEFCPVLLSKLLLEVCCLYSTLNCEFASLTVTLHNISEALKNSTADPVVLKVCNMHVMAAKEGLNKIANFEKGVL